MKATLIKSVTLKLIGFGFKKSILLYQIDKDETQLSVRPDDRWQFLKKWNDP